MSLSVRRHIDLAGSRLARRTGASYRFDDFYHATLAMNWYAFCAAIGVCFVGINILFGGLYALLPGAIERSGAGSFLDGFFFSIETLGTVGYGHMYPASRIGNVVASIEILTGLFFTAAVTGLIFARFSRPRAGMVFSRHALIGQHEGRPALMIRAVSTRAHPMAAAEAHVAWLKVRTLPDGSTVRQLVPVALLEETNPMFSLSWTLIGILEENCGLLEALDSGGRFYISVFIRGTDVLIASESVGVRIYGPDEVLRNRRFREMVIPRGKAVDVDMNSLDDTEPLDADVC